MCTCLYFLWASIAFFNLFFLLFVYYSIYLFVLSSGGYDPHFYFPHTHHETDESF